MRCKAFESDLSNIGQVLWREKLSSPVHTAMQRICFRTKSHLIFVKYLLIQSRVRFTRNGRAMGAVKVVFNPASNMLLELYPE